MGGWQEEVGIKLFFLDFFRWVLCTVLVSTGVLVLIVLLQYKYKPAHRTHHANCRNHNIINKLNYYINIILSSPFSFSILFLLSFLPSYSSFLLLLLLLLLLTILPYYYFFLLLNNYYFFLLYCIIIIIIYYMLLFMRGKLCFSSPGIKMPRRTWENAKIFILKAISKQE